MTNERSNIERIGAADTGGRMAAVSVFIWRSPAFGGARRRAPGRAPPNAGDLQMKTETAAIRPPVSAAPMRSMFERSFVMPAVWESFRRLTPQAQWRNPVMFVCYVGAIFTTLLFFQ